MEHCCKQMCTYLEDARIPLSYSPRFREYNIDFLTNPHAKQGIVFCPWCNAKLPESVRDEYFDILQNEYGIESDIAMLQGEGVPEEFKSDAWWKKRGL